jgi:hypothetical protein
MTSSSPCGTSTSCAAPMMRSSSASLETWRGAWQSTSFCRWWPRTSRNAGSGAHHRAHRLSRDWVGSQYHSSARSCSSSRRRRCTSRRSPCTTWSRRSRVRDLSHRGRRDRCHCGAWDEAALPIRSHARLQCGTRNSFVVLPFALALPEAWEAAIVVIVLQSLVELWGMVAYLWAVPRILPRDGPRRTGRRH